MKVMYGSDLERHWALKSSNLRKLKDNSNGDNRISNNKKRSSLTTHYNNTDIRKSSYPVLPSPFIKPSKPLDDNVNPEANIPVDSFGNASPVPSIMSQNGSLSRVIDNKHYINHFRNKSDSVGYVYNQKEHPNGYVDMAPKQYVLRQNRVTSHHQAGGRMTLKIFHLLQSITLEIIDETFEDDLVPDILIETIKEIEHDETVFLTKVIPAVRLTAEQILSEVLDQHIQETVLSLLLHDSKNQLKSMSIMKGFIDEMLPLFVKDVITDSVQDIVDDQIAVKRSEYFYNKLEESVVHDELYSLEHVIFREAFLETVLEETIIEPVVQDLIADVGKNMIEYYLQKVSRINLHQISQMANERPLANLCLNHFVSVGSKQCSNYGSNRVSHFVFESFVFDILSVQSQKVLESLFETVENRPLRRWHQNLNKEIASNALLEELIPYVDSDLCDLDAEEVQEHYIPRYVTGVDELFRNITKK